MLTPYEERIIREIAEHQIHPNALQRLLETLGKPVGRFLRAGRESHSRIIRGMSDQVHGWVEDGIIRTLKTGSRFISFEDVTRRYYERGFPVQSIASLRQLPMEELDAVANTFLGSSTMAIGIEGAFMGGVGSVATGIPGAQLLIPSIVVTDIAASMTLLSRHVCRVATCYGYASSTPDHLPHLIAAMAPQAHTSDEGYLTLKTAVAASIRESSQFLARTATIVMDRQILEREAPQMIRLIAYVAERLGLVITQKELGLLVPIAGAILNSSINVAFQRVAHTTSQDYFRRLVLEEKYGEDVVRDAVREEVRRLHPD